MSNDDKEILSGLMDGEWNDIDPAGSVKMACADDELKATWSRYHLIRDIIRNDSITVDASLSKSISQAIEDEPAYTNVSAIGGTGADSSSATFTAYDAHVETDTQTTARAAENSAASSAASSVQSQRKPGYWRTGLSGVALAACVALATVIGLNFWQGAPNSDAGAGVQSIATTTMPGLEQPKLEYVSNKGTYWVTSEAKRSADAEKRLNMLLSTHIESSPTAERTGMLPYSRLVGYDSVSPEQ